MQYIKLGDTGLDSSTVSYPTDLRLTGINRTAVRLQKCTPAVTAQQFDGVAQPRRGGKLGFRLCSSGCEDSPARLTMALTSQRRGVRQSNTGVRS
jgi:hypothetical protein